MSSLLSSLREARIALDEIHDLVPLEQDRKTSDELIQKSNAIWNTYKVLQTERLLSIRQSPLDIDLGPLVLFVGNGRYDMPCQVVANHSLWKDILSPLKNEDETTFTRAFCMLFLNKKTDEELKADELKADELKAGKSKKRKTKKSKTEPSKPDLFKRWETNSIPFELEERIVETVFVKNVYICVHFW